VETVSLGLWVGAGSRSEDLPEHGVAHFLEHMAFKGTDRRSAQAIAEEIESVGGELNAATGIDSTAYYARVLRQDFGLALDILSDIILAPRFDRTELARERDVILQEIASAQDSPEDMVFDLAQTTAFPDQPAGRPILGTAKSVKGFKSTHLKTYLAAHYQAPNMVLAAAGAVDHESLLAEAERLLLPLDPGTAPLPAPAAYRGGVARNEKSFEQTHLVLAFEAPPYRHADYFAAQVCAGALGGGMSSRLFQEVREQRGLCYAIYAFHAPYSDTGMFGLYAGTDATDVAELMRVVVEEINGAAETINEAEVARAKAQMKAGLLMALESSGARAEQLARQMLHWGRPIPLDELVGKIEAVTIESARAAGRALIACGGPAVAALGPGGGLESAATIADSLVRRAA
jgi:predicted Zn-dependent peptidase